MTEVTFSIIKSSIFCNVGEAMQRIQKNTLFDRKRLNKCYVPNFVDVSQGLRPLSSIADGRYAVF